MAYIGKTPITGNFVKLDAISVVNGQASYTMNNGGSAFTDYETVNQFLVSLNGILQSPTTSFTVSGSTLTFASNLSTGDVIDFVIVLGNTLDIGTPSDNTVSLAKLTATGTKDATTFLRGDNTFAEAGGGIEVADGWRITTGFNGSGDTFITSGWEQIDDASFGSLGSSMTESSGVFTFPSTGIYLVQFQMSYHTAINGYVKGRIWITIDNSSYDKVAESIGYLQAGELSAQYCFALVDVTNTSNVKAKFGFNGANASSGAYGSTTDTQTGVNFIRLGDT